jgi:hypothetical protein
VRVLLFGKGHLGMGFLSDRNFMDSNEVIVIHRNNLDEYADNPLQLNKIDLAILAIGESGGVAFNIENGHSLFKKNIDLNSKIFRIVSTLGCRTINLVPSCVYPVSDFGVKSKETDLFKGQPELTSLEYAHSQLNRIKTLNETIDQSLLKHVVLTNIFGSSNSEKKNSHFFDHLTQAIEVSKNNRVVLKGSADAVRDFLYNKEISGIVHFLITNWNSIESVTNFAGYGGSRIADIANEFLKTLNLQLDIHFDNPELMGSRYKVLDDSKARLLGWEPRYRFKDAILDWHQR